VVCSGSLPFGTSFWSCGRIYFAAKQSKWGPEDKSQSYRLLRCLLELLGDPDAFSSDFRRWHIFCMGKPNGHIYDHLGWHMHGIVCVSRMGVGCRGQYSEPILVLFSSNLCLTNDATASFQESRHPRYSRPESAFWNSLLFSSLLPSHILSKRQTIFATTLSCSHDTFCGWPVHFLHLIRPIRLPNQSVMARLSGADTHYGPWIKSDSIIQ
jgi:hypothetical protein